MLVPWRHIRHISYFIPNGCNYGFVVICPLIQSVLMSVLHANDRGWLLDARSLIDKAFQCCLSVNKEHVRYRFNKQYFDIFKPHMVVKGSSDVSSSVLTNPETRACEEAKPDLKKRKRKQSDLNQGEIDAQVYHEKVRLLVLDGCQSLLGARHLCSDLTKSLPAEPAKQMPLHMCQLAALCDMAKQLFTAEPSYSVPEQKVTGDSDLDAHIDLFSRVTEFPDVHAREVTLMGERYLLPPRSRFLLSDVTRLHPLVNCGDKYDLIVLDPPWENKSVKRSGRYSFLPSSQLKQLPIPALSAAGCLIVTWVTNRPRHLRFVREELYPHWGVKLQAEWLWVKVTQAGEFVFPLDSLHKKPYEVLLIGRFCAKSDTTTGLEECEIPDHRLIVSIPSVLHSHKPSLSDVLKPYIRRDARCLEMFARSLQPGWTSWGNEVLKFQHHSYFSTERLEQECGLAEPKDTDQSGDTEVEDATAHLSTMV